MPYAMAQEVVTRTTLVLDDAPVAKAEALTGIKGKSALVREALEALIERDSAHRLARLGGSEAHLEAAPRRHAGAA
jgi:Arc/MetJ family transcription regulator